MSPRSRTWRTGIRPKLVKDLTQKKSIGMLSMAYIEYIPSWTITPPIKGKDKGHDIIQL